MLSEERFFAHDLLFLDNILSAKQALTKVVSSLS